jgi:MFS family permease
MIITRRREHTRLNLLWIPLTIQDTALITIAVPAAIAVMAPKQHITALAFLASAASFSTMLVPPFAGWLSDRGRRSGVPRRTWIFVALAFDVAALIALMFARTLVLFDVLFIMAVAAEAVAIAAYQAMIPEVVPRAAWGFASGIRGAATLIGTVVGLGIAGRFSNSGIVFAITAGLLVLGALSLVGLHEGEWTEPEHVHGVRWHDFIVVFIARSFVFFGLSLLTTFVLYFFSDVLGARNPSAGTAFVGIFSLLGSIVSSIVLGQISDRVPRRIVVALCGVPMAIAAFGFALVPDMRVIYAFALLFGIGLGGAFSVGWALAMDSVPKLRDVARDLGIWGIATGLPSVLAPAVGGWILSAYNGQRLGYQMIFALAGASFALGSISVLRVGAYARQVAPVNQAQGGTAGGP